MAEKKTEPLPLVKLVAVSRGFYNGRMVEPGTKFEFDPNPRKEGGPVQRLPKWAAEPGKAAPKKPAAMGYDTKPADAQAAVKAKAGELGANVG